MTLNGIMAVILCYCFLSRLLIEQRFLLRQSQHTVCNV